MARKSRDHDHGFNWLLDLGSWQLALGIVYQCQYDVGVFLTLPLPLDLKLRLRLRLRLLLSRWDLRLISAPSSVASVFFLNAFKHLRNLLFNVRTCVRCSMMMMMKIASASLLGQPQPHPHPCPSPFPTATSKLPRLWRDDEANITNLRVINRRPTGQPSNQATKQPAE